MTFKSVTLVTICLITMIGQLCAQQIYPVPQKILQKGDSIPYTGISIQRVPANIRTPLLPYIQKHGLKVKFKQNKKLSHKEAYKLSISKKGIQITYKNRRGAFYAAQSLRQLLNKAARTSHLPSLTIEDYPDIAYRGVVEGFYGNPWSFEARVAQLKFYGAWKLNTYIYGPKDDLYHSSPNWRKPYPTREASRIRQLIRIAGENEVDFYWAVHPGKDIQWNRSDSLAVLHKFQLMYDLGVRHFAVFFDDISGEGTKAEKQAGLLNYLQTEFVDKKQDVGTLIMCPTEYNKLWANPKPGTYLDILGEQLDKRIKIMWTGNSVIHDITQKGQHWVNGRIKRQAFVWWNFPVNDYVRNHLLLGPVYGLDQNIKNDLSGFVSNPMDKAEASKVAIFSVADFTWNNKAYQSKKAWMRGIKVVVPEVADSYRLFAENNADPGPSYHKYRRTESSPVSQPIDRLVAHLEQITTFPVSPKNDDLSLVSAELAKFNPAARDIIDHAKNRALIREIEPWLLHFGTLGEAGCRLISLLKATNEQEAYQQFLKLQHLRNELLKIDKNHNQNPYQPGIVTGGRHILPWIEKSYFHFARLFREKGFAVPAAPDQAEGRVITSLVPLQRLPVLSDVITENRPQQVLKLSAILEPVQLSPGDYIGLEITSAQFIQSVRYKSSVQDAALQLQYSEDGKHWSTRQGKSTKRVRLINTSTRAIDMVLKKFEVILK